MGDYVAVMNIKTYKTRGHLLQIAAERWPNVCDDSMLSFTWLFVLEKHHFATVFSKSKQALLYAP